MPNPYPELDRRNLFILAVLGEAITYAAKGKKSVSAEAVQLLKDYKINSFLEYMFTHDKVAENAVAFVKWLGGEGPIPEFYSHYMRTYGRKDEENG